MIRHSNTSSLNNVQNKGTVGVEEYRLSAVCESGTKNLLVLFSLF